MIELNDLNGRPFVLNCDLIETIESIPETKISITTGKYMLVENSAHDVIERVVAFYQRLYGNQKTILIANKTNENSDIAQYYESDDLLK